MGSTSPITPETNASTYVQRGLDALRANGLRITQTRRAVLQTLGEAAEALSPYAIHSRIKDAQGQIDVVSVYRILETLQTLDLVHHVGLADGYRACGLDHAHESHSQHMICRDCRKVVEVDLPKDVVAHSLSSAAKAGFHGAQVHLEILAVCDDCEPGK
jgi:Fe2+ or Zn2+ uptake regulation protein